MVYAEPVSAACKGAGGEEAVGRNRGARRRIGARRIGLGRLVFAHLRRSALAEPRNQPLGREHLLDATIHIRRFVDGGCSSAAERLTVAQDVVGSIPTSRPSQSKRLKADFLL